MVRFLFLGEITGRPGITAVKNGLPALKDKHEIDYVIANAEGATNGFGLGPAHSVQLSKLGVNLLTGGEKLFFKADFPEFIQKAGFVLRPANYPVKAPGKSYRAVELKGKRFIIISLQGNALLKQGLANAFTSIELLLRKLKEKEPEAYFLVFFHAAASAEKRTMLFFLDGQVSAVIGTHAKVLTADETVTEKGTGYITDNGRVGSFMSAGGFDPDTEIQKLRSQMPVRSRECWEDGRIQGVIVSIDESTGRCVSVERVMEKVPIKAPEKRV